MTATHSPWLILASIAVAIFASYTAIDLATRVHAARGAAARAWLVGGAVAMGIGMWSMHFIGMLALSLPFEVSYHVPITFGSLLLAVAFAGGALHAVSRETVRQRDLAAGTALLGVGGGAMHGLGIAAVKGVSVSHDPSLLALATVVAFAGAHAALLLAFKLRGGRYAKLGAALVLGAGMCGMHYIAMAAAHWVPPTLAVAGAGADNMWLVTAIAATTLLVLCTGLALSISEARSVSHTASMAASLKRANEELRRLALHDPLTTLPNRLLLEDRIEQALAHGHRGGRQSAVLFIDLDRFKAVNDSLGHFVGDELLRAVATRLQTLVRAEDTVSRIGGDEFVLLLREVSGVADAEVLAKRVLQSLREPFRIHEQELYVTPSVGVAVFPEHGDSAQMLITRADAAMYKAKQAGRNTYEVFAADMAAFYPERLTLEHDLRRAVARGEFELYYHPKVDVQTGRILGIEALVRWHHPQKGIIAPQDFIPIAEETGLIIPIGNWVFERACAQNKAWQNAGLPNLRVAVNISRMQFRQKDLVQVVSQALTSAGLEPECLEIEVNESIVMQNASEAIVIIERLSALGVNVSIDDFGTGYSSLSYLKRFRIDKLKIDRSFIRDISSDMDDAAIVRATIGLAHNLRLKVVAEGVETADQLHFLRSLGCDEYQGYYKSRPLTAAEFERNLRAETREPKVVPIAS